MASPRIRQSGILPLPVAIERYLQVALYLLVLTGFGTLASTGSLDAPTVLLVGGALLVRGYLLSRRKNLQIPAQWTTYLTLAYVPFYLLDLTTFSRAFLPATVHLVLFGMVVRMFSARKDRDFAFLAALAFVMVLASAVLTVDSIFLLAFGAFLLMAVVTFVLMEMRKTSQTATVSARTTIPQGYRKMAFSLVGLAPVLVGLMLVGAAGIFFVLPRMSTGYLGGFAAGTDFSTGFSEKVELGKIGQIQQSNAVVMHIQIEGDHQGQYDLKWRGVALGRFDGKTWSNPSEHNVLSPQPDGRFALWPRTQRSAGEKTIRYRVLMEPIGTNVFFLANSPRYLTGGYRLLAWDRAGAIFDLDAEHPITVYDAESDLPPARAKDLADTGNAYSAQIQQAYLQLPSALDARIAPLAKEITDKATGNYAKAVAIEQYLTTHYEYSLQLPQIEPKDPLATFLFERKRGHCEYFASSMAVMLRTVGVPSRVVNGFRTTEFNDVTSSYVVRASSAHSWVEADFPGYGWVAFDPTPPGAAVEHGPWNRAMLYLDAMASFWREWVVNYDANHQRALGQDALRGTRTMAEEVRDWARQKYAALLRRARRAQHVISESPKEWSAVGVGTAVLLLFLVNLGRLVEWMRRRRLAAHPEEAPVQAAALWYARLTARLARQGVRKTEAQTPREFLAGIEQQPLRARVEKFTSAYEAARFGGSPEEASKLPELYEEALARDKR